MTGMIVKQRLGLRGGGGRGVEIGGSLRDSCRLNESHKHIPEISLRINKYNNSYSYATIF